MMSNMSLNRNKSSFDAKMHKKLGTESFEFLTASKFEYGKRVNLNIGERRLSNSSASSSVYSDEQNEEDYSTLLKDIDGSVFDKNNKSGSLVSDLSSNSVEIPDHLHDSNFMKELRNVNLYYWKEQHKLAQ